MTKTVVRKQEGRQRVEKGEEVVKEREEGATHIINCFEGLNLVLLLLTAIVQRGEKSGAGVAHV